MINRREKVIVGNTWFKQVLSRVSTVDSRQSTDIMMLSSQSDAPSSQQQLLLQLPKPSNNLVRAMLTDLYQLTMTYAHWKIGKHNDSAVIELFFRKNPFKGQYTIFCGLDECVKHLQSFQFTTEDVEYLKSTPSMAHCDEGYFEYLLSLDTSQLKVFALSEGTVAFPKIPLIVLEGPLGLCQLLETTLLNLVNFPSLLATNASRMVLRAHPAPCIEFGLRRAQGPDGAFSASKYAYVGGFVGTSNVQAGKDLGIPIVGTHAHAYVQAFSSLDEVSDLTLFNNNTMQDEPFLQHVLKYRPENRSTNDGELASFVAYACAFPHNCLCLIDTYDTLESGLQNFVFVAKALDDFGYKPKGVRLDSGNLAFLSVRCKQAFDEVIAEQPSRRDAFSDLTIVVSNDINEQALVDLSKTRHEITSYGIGTNLVTCQAQPALGCVYKLVEWNGRPRIKLSQDLPKVTIPGRKRAYRLYGKDGRPLVDFLALADEQAPIAGGDPVVCRHPFQQQQRFKVQPSRVESLHHLVFDGTAILDRFPDDLSATRTYVLTQLQNTFPDSLTRHQNPEEYGVMVSSQLYEFLHSTWEKEFPMKQLE
ncbi:nicotinate phosphoribosyltransferase [Nitzschia inconspicua]|uniref:Nicotinate phosphoribosyltransferase n=1 Tax=Nitzschia inconspicua TaxID=303405 RepID=A0A9K3LKL7_9STRA|nr:nicotinate phosphoribosyltransferase [Nitzschia inconspicua]